MYAKFESNIVLIFSKGEAYFREAPYIVLTIGVRSWPYSQILGFFLLCILSTGNCLSLPSNFHYVYFAIRHLMHKPSPSNGESLS
jgi:hypothetical protein